MEKIWNYNKYEYLNKIINISCHSPRLENILVKQKNDDYIMRPSLHLLLSFPPGSFKTERMKSIEKTYGLTQRVEYCADVTGPGLIGSIDTDSREIVAPMAYSCKRGTLLIDELSINPKTQNITIKQMLTFLEDERTARKIGIKATEKQEKEFKMESALCKNGWLKFWDLRCNVIFATMRNYRMSRGQIYYTAMLTRVTPIRYDISIDDIDKMLDDRKLIFEKLEFNLDSSPIENKDFEMIRATVKGYGGLVPQINYVRSINDCLRCYAVLREHDADLYDFVITNRNWKREEICTIHD